MNRGRCEEFVMSYAEGWWWQVGSSFYIKVERGASFISCCGALTEG